MLQWKINCVLKDLPSIVRIAEKKEQLKHKEINNSMKE